MPDLVRTLMIITGIIVVLFMLLIGFNVWAFTNVPARLVSPAKSSTHNSFFTQNASPVMTPSKWAS
ncbi:hypothetical protein [Endozoicomonas numazuensis]|uniref:Uncharacterized protein n=1 Tax=Endozoicomonas numazuensis TaxID=1137799 RepID=A0A081NE30_9GAMM|nr:hypothetical protein [Endozoicomonas numazuensis]KEQ16703.1 hypothetical protein GZ78_18560 [Endozoicomonas numazuensis]